MTELNGCEARKIKVLGNYEHIFLKHFGKYIQNCCKMDLMYMVWESWIFVKVLPDFKFNTYVRLNNNDIFVTSDLHIFYDGIE